ncbi:hypothetical protein VNI00_004646 [Paramarasmius palmivorus]|uniref:Uncharacterized protein n=1 Tax=Paramarasmius palmivorus TaxID=297713 RepID=A0AAW0DI45_9AGAR
MKTLSVDGGDDDTEITSLTLRTWRTALPFDFSIDDHPRYRPNVSIQINWAEERSFRDCGNPKFFEKVFKAAFRALPLSTVETMHLGTFPVVWNQFLHCDDESELLLKAFVPCMGSSHLRNLVLDGSRCAECLPKLLEYPGLDLPLPALETLVLIDPLFCESSVERLYECLQSRTQEMMLQTLVVVGAGGETINRLRTVVEEIESEET